MSYHGRASSAGEMGRRLRHRRFQDKIQGVRGADKGCAGHVRMYAVLSVDQGQQGPGGS